MPRNAGSSPRRFRVAAPPKRVSWRGAAPLTPIVAICCFLSACSRALPPDPPPAGVVAAADVDAWRPRVEAFCGDCHAAPLAGSFPRDAWYDEVKRGYKFYRDSGRNDLDPPPEHEVVHYYRALAPEKMELASASGDVDESGFEKTSLALPAGVSFPAVAHLLIQSPAHSKPGRMVLCDMRSGHVQQISFNKRIIESTPLAQLKNPAHAQRCDLNSDGIDDYVVAELGSAQPADHDLGKVIWLRGQQDGRFTTIVLQDSLARVADVQPADFDLDGDLDLVVAEFGWQTTGRVLVLWNNSPASSTPVFEMQVIDRRHGAIHTPVADLNGDGRPDFVALISQEHEVVEAFLNQGDGSFKRQTIFAAQDPSYGSSGIQLVDLDSDGDVDVLYTNGDTMDSYYLKPHHSIRWLENEGDFPFVDRAVADMPGVYRALAGDLDGDDDLDIVACAYIPYAQLLDSPRERLDTLIWLEQTDRGAFVRRRLQQSERGHMALELGDFDGDGRLDFAVGGYGESATGSADWITIWWNQGLAKPAD